MSPDRNVDFGGVLGSSGYADFLVVRPGPVEPAAAFDQLQHGAIWQQRLRIDVGIDRIARDKHLGQRIRGLRVYAEIQTVTVEEA